MEKDIGVTFDASLEFRIHIKAMVSKANSRVGLIKRTFSKLNIYTFKLLYKSLVILGDVGGCYFKREGPSSATR